MILFFISIFCHDLEKIETGIFKQLSINMAGHILFT